MAIETMRGTSMTDQNQAVAALAEAMEEAAPKYKGETLVFWASIALQAIAAQPDILRSMGLGRLLTWNEFVDVILPGPVGDETSVPAGAAAERMRDAGFLRPDPDPPAAPELPSVLSDIDALYRRAVARETYIQQEYRKGSDAWDECDRNLSGLKDIRQRLVDRAANGGFDAAAEAGRSS